MLGESPILAMASHPTYAGVRAAVWEAIAESKSAQFSDVDLRGYRGDRPGWISGRICCIVLAAELVRLISDQPPTFKAVRELIEARPAARNLIFQSRNVREDLSFCQFPAKS